MTTRSDPTAPDAWRPPSASLELRDGLWQVESVSAVSYPAAGNEVCFQVEDESYWFQHRMACIKAVLRQFPPAGTFYDIGGGNGYVAAALQAAGTEVVLVEPGPGARNALHRGVHRVICATLEDARFARHSLPAAGAFDVIEHNADDAAFLRNVREQLAPGGRFYCTVPAGRALWSAEDRHAGHFRRYDPAGLRATLRQAGFTVEFLSPFFSWLTVPVFCFRALPSRLRLVDEHSLGTAAVVQSDHHLPARLSGLVGRIHAWELARLRGGRPLPFGTSLLCVARVDHS